MKIRKYQAGAIIYTPTPTGGQATSTQMSASSSSASEKPEKITGTMLKEIMDQLKEDGLPADVEQVLNYAARYLDKSSHLTDMSLFGGKDTEYNIKDWINITKLVKEAKWNKELYDDASDKLKEEDAWNDVATDTNGKIWLSNGKNLSKVSVSEYVKEREKLTESGYVPISYNTLGDFRSRYFGFDKNGMLEDMKAAVGMKSITKQLVDIVTKFEATEVSEYKFSQGTDRIRDASGRSYQLEAVKDGLEALTSGGPSGYYKLTQKTKVDKSNVEDALDYLWNSLGDSAQNAVRAKLAVEGDNPNNGDAVKTFLTDIISFHARNKVDVNFDSSATNYDPNGTGKKGGNIKEENLSAQDTYQIAFVNGEGRDTYVDLTPKASKIYETGTMHTRAIGFGPMVSAKDTTQVLGDHMNLPEWFQKSALASSLQIDSITFGNRLLENWELPAIMYEGGQQTYSVYLPYKEINGKISPDFKLFDRYNKYLKAIKDNPNMPDIEKRSLLSQLQLTGPGIDSSDLKNIRLKNTMRFLTFKAVAGDDTIELDSIKNYLGKLDREMGKLFKVPYNNALKYNTTTPQKNEKVTNKKFESATAGDFYEGNVYIPVDVYAGYRTSSNEPVTKSSLTDIDRKIKANNILTASREYAMENDPNYEDNLNIGKFK